MNNISFIKIQFSELFSQFRISTSNEIWKLFSQFGMNQTGRFNCRNVSNISQNYWPVWIG